MERSRTRTGIWMSLTLRLSHYSTNTGSTIRVWSQRRLISSRRDNVDSPIPIQNIYYLLCYAWNRLDEKDIVDVSSLMSTQLVDLFAKVLISGTHHLVRRGFDRGYLEF